MDKAITIGIDISKHIFQVHGVDGFGAVVLRKRLRRVDFLAFFARQAPVLIGMEACGGAHHWARELIKLGHEVRLMPAAYVKPYVKRQKNDAADAEAICEAVGRPSMRFVAVKSCAQQGALMLHRVRDLLVGQQTALINALRGHLSEFGLVAAQGRGGVEALLDLVEGACGGLDAVAQATLALLAGQLRHLKGEIAELDRKLALWHRQNALSQRLASIPGIGTITASAIAATVADASAFASGRDFAAWLGLVPRQNSSGGKEKLGHITRAGDGYIRHLLVVGATAILARRGKGSSAMETWGQGLRERKGFRLASVAIANKMARIAWALMAHGGLYRKEGMPRAPEATMATA